MPRSTPMADMPAHLAPLYTMDFSVPVYSWFLDDSVSSPESRTWTKKVMRRCQSILTNINIMGNLDVTEDMNKFLPFSLAGKFLIDALKNISLFGKSIAVMESVFISPWLVCILLNNGARDITIVGHDHHLPVLEDRTYHLETISIEDFVSSDKTYDYIFALSFVQHLGLGRYGDEFSPDQDLFMMRCLHKKLRRLLFLLIPIGNDCLVWNAHRIYGSKRLSLLLQDFQEVRWIGWSKDALLDREIEGNLCMAHQPLMILKKN